MIVKGKGRAERIAGLSGTTFFQKGLRGSGFVTKLGRAGNALVYSTYLGGSGSSFASSIAVDAHLNAYVTGGTTAPNFPTKNAFQKTLESSNGNAFITKLCPAGNALIYSTYLGGSSGDSGNGIAVDHWGQAYVTGQTASTDFPTRHAFQNAFAGGNRCSFFGGLDDS